MSNKQIIMYIASPTQASEFKNRCQTISDEVEIATLGTFGKETPHDSFLKMSKLMLKGSVNWTIFHWQDVSQLIGSQVLTKELRELIKAGANRRSKTFIVDVEGALDKNAMAAFGIGVVKDEMEIGMPFAKMLDNKQLEIARASKQNDAFEGINAPAKDYSDEDRRLPGMSSSTPGSVSRDGVDPFGEFEQEDSTGGADPFADYDNEGGNAPQKYNPADPFTTFDQPGSTGSAASNGASAGAGNAGSTDDDIFAELADDLGAINMSDDLGNSFGEDVFDDNLFDMLTAEADETIVNAEDPNNPFAAFEFMDDNSVRGGEDAFADGDPFAAMMENLDKKDENAGSGAAGNVDVASVIGGVGGSMDGSFMAEEVISPDGQGTAGTGDNAGGAADPNDPFAAFEQQLAQEEPQSVEAETPAFDDSIFDGSQAFDSDDEEIFDPFEDGNVSDGDFDDEEEFDDPFGKMTEEDKQLAKNAVMQAENGGGIVVAGQRAGNTHGDGADPFAGRNDLTLDDIFDYYGDRIAVMDYNKLVSMLEPEWDYTNEHMDGIGLAGGSGAKGLIGGGKKNKVKGSYSQVEEYTLADSLYIPEMEAQNGIYSPPEECKIIASSSLKGGSGKSIHQESKIIKIKDNGKHEWVQAKDIVVGDKLFNRRGKPVEVLGVYPQGKLDVYRMTFADGRFIDCSADHIWTVAPAEDNNERDLTTAELIEHGVTDIQNKPKWRIPVVEAMDFPEIPSYDIDIDNVSDACDAGSIGQRQDIIDAVIATGTVHDGYATISGDNENLVNICSVARSLGYVCTMGEGKLNIALDKENNRYVAISSIEKLDEHGEMICFYVDDEEHLFVAGDYIVTHNTSIAVGIATQLNWYFNKALMQKLTTNYQSRVLILSINEFDDIPVHGIGYEGFDPDQDEDGRNIAELLRRIDETAGNTTWDDIMHCFVATDQNRVFYLPSLTQREMLEENINITAEDYKRVFECCSKFFQFIVVDTPDIFYQEKNDLMNFIYSTADIIAMVIEPDARSVTNLYHFFNGLEVETGRVPLNPAKCMLIVNKYVSKDNPYIVMPIDQLTFENITKGTHKYFSRYGVIPFTHPRGTSNVLYGTDPKVKEAYADVTDTILEMIAQNDLVEDQKKKKKH